MVRDVLKIQNLQNPKLEGTSILLQMFLYYNTKEKTPQGTRWEIPDRAKKWRLVPD